ncbi:hydrolase 1, exosortase A system-associated [Novosphingobium sp. Leaf2]|uniref:hydrolase 1, exosortase A system-associated n=1 Tax=Novosphingobium sp. Leaf2 TaxID=1735670 RepID=UPI0006FA8533|nr:hydrolase 1, exosortase A system-associated [Novosphingobium sp. Leaf2]KQM19342.1 esterase [Novosphingobium sp. Leaf2]
MTRRHITFACAGDTLVGTLDAAPARTALLLVSGGNEVRAGAWNGQALFAARIAARGYPVLRFDRRGVGDSEGANRGFEDAGEDIAAACAALRQACPQVTHVVGMGNCDAASALMLAHGAGLDGLVLSNPWTIEEDSEDAPAEVVRDHYRRRLADPAAIRRLLTGKVSPLKLARSLLSMLRPSPAAPDGLAARLAAGIAGFSGPVRFLVAGRDRTGLAFLSRWDKDDARIHRFADATHSYVEPHAQDWLVEQTLTVLSTFNG